jgi:hypothetical protein
MLGCFENGDEPFGSITCGQFIDNLGHAVAQLVEVLCYKPEGRGFDSRWRLWNFSLT